MKERVVVGTLTVVAVVAVASCKDDVGLTSIPPEPERFVAFLSGANEPNAITTAAQGFATFTRDSNSLIYRITLSNVDSAFAAHIHAGPAGVSGGIIVGLYGSPSPVTDLAFSGTLIEDTVVVVDSVLTRMRNGTAYVNVHTKKNPGGEIRGQVFQQ
jgi:hypothetical protein